MVTLINQKRAMLFSPLPGFPGTKATPEQIIDLKNHVLACADQIIQVRARMEVSQRALAELPAADVEAAVVKGYPPPP